MPLPNAQAPPRRVKISQAQTPPNGLAGAAAKSFGVAIHKQKAVAEAKSATASFFMWMGALSLLFDANSPKTALSQRLG
jgi:hypothetical protein